MRRPYGWLEMVSHVVNARELEQTVREWFGSAEFASLELPSGWFGRPYDNLHQLTWSETRGDKLILELDHIVHLVITTPAATEITDDDLRIIDFSQVVLDRQDYGSSTASHAEVFTTGVVRLAGHPKL